jgi:hypothetical protein
VNLLTPNSWGTPLQEFNKCHSKADGRFCGDAVEPHGLDLLPGLSIDAGRLEIRSRVGSIRLQRPVSVPATSRTKQVEGSFMTVDQLHVNPGYPAGARLLFHAAQEFARKLGYRGVKNVRQARRTHVTRAHW